MEWMDNIAQILPIIIQLFPRKENFQDNDIEFLSD